MKSFRIDDYPLFQMAQVIAATHDHIVSRVTSYKLTPSAWRAIALLAEGEAWTVKTLADAAVIERSALSRIIDKLEGDGIVERTANPRDGRSSSLSLSTRGRALYDECTPFALEAMETAFRGVDRSEMHELASVLGRVIDNLKDQQYGVQAKSKK